jgi:hypothetical protein
MNSSGILDACPLVPCPRGSLGLPRRLRVDAHEKAEVPKNLLGMVSPDPFSGGRSTSRGVVERIERTEAPSPKIAGELKRIAPPYSAWPPREVSGARAGRLQAGHEKGCSVSWKSVTKTLDRISREDAGTQLPEAVKIEREVREDRSEIRVALRRGYRGQDER